MIQLGILALTLLTFLLPSGSSFMVSNPTKTKLCIGEGGVQKMVCIKLGVEALNDQTPEQAWAYLNAP